MFDDETTVAWRAMPYRAPVVAADGSEIGTAESLLGDEARTSFTASWSSIAGAVSTSEIPAARIEALKITEKHVVTDLTEADMATLEPYREEHWFHIGWGGLFRKHLRSGDQTSRS